MGDIVSTLFGGSESESRQRSGPVDVTPPRLRQLRGPFASTLEQLLGAREGDPLSGIPQFQGDLTAPVREAEQNILENLQQRVEGPRSQLLRSTMRGEFLPGGEQENPFLQATIDTAQRRTQQNLQETLGRTLPGRFTAAGHFVQPEGSSAFDRAAALATRGAAQEMGDIATRLAGQAYEAERGRQQEAIQLGQQDVETTIRNLQAQALPRLVEDQGIERGLSEFQNRINNVIRALQTASGQIAQFGQESTGTSESESQKGIIPGLASGFSALFPAGI